MPVKSGVCHVVHLNYLNPLIYFVTIEITSPYLGKHLQYLSWAAGRLGWGRKDRN